MKLPALITNLALRILSEANKMSGVERLRLTASRLFDSDSRYIRINPDCGNNGVIRISSHPSPNYDHKYDLNLVVHNDKEQQNAFEVARQFLLDTYGPEIQTT